MKKIFFASDHAGYALKRELMELFKEYECIDIAGSKERCDYPDSASALATAMQNDPDAIGVVVCGSGLGISMAANRFSHIRAALCDSTDMAKLARAHNDANVLALGARFIACEQAACVLKAFLEGEFEGGRHAARVQKLSDLNAALNSRDAAN